MFKLNKVHLIGILLIIISLVLFFTNILDNGIRMLTQPLLMGSSKGKDILFFFIYGFFLIVSELENYNIIKKIPWPKFLRRTTDDYLRLVFILLFFLGVCGLISEVNIRYSLHLGVFTIFNAMDPTMTSTSILHSHVYKSVFGVIINTVLTVIPTGIHTGSSLEQYIPFYAKLLFILIPITGLMMVKAVQNRSFYTRIVLCFALSIGIIGLIDGGFFSTPFLGGMYLIIVKKYNSNTLEYWVGKAFNKKDWCENVEDDPYVIKHFTDYKAGLKNIIPHLILLFIILLRLSVAFVGSNSEYYEADIMHPENVDLSHFDTIKIVSTDNSLNVEFNSSYNEMELENKLGENLKGKCEYYTLSWNTYSYL